MENKKFLFLTSLFLFLLSFLIIAFTLPDFGIVWDEPTYFTRASLRAKWLKLFHPKSFFNPTTSPFSSANLVKYWKYGAEHPAFSHLVAGFSYIFFHRWLGERMCFRLGTAFLAALLTATLFLFLAYYFNLRVALIAALSFFCLPRVFAHSHFCTLDLPITCLWFLTVCTFYHSLNSSWRWKVLAGILFGLALNTKLNAFFLPAALFPWLFLFYRRKENFFRYLLLFLFLGLLTSLATWAWFRQIDFWRKAFFALTALFAWLFLFSRGKKNISKFFLLFLFLGLLTSLATWAWFHQIDFWRKAFFALTALFAWFFLFFRGKKGLFETSFPSLFLFFLLFLLLGFLTFITTWPWLWEDTFLRLDTYLSFHREHFSIPVYYFGHVYSPSLPWHYPFIIVLFTTSPFILILGIVGLASFKSFSDQTSLKILFAWNFLLPLLIHAIPRVLVYDGIRLFLPIYPFLCLFTGLGFDFCWRKIKEHLSPFLSQRYFKGLKIEIFFAFLFLGSNFYSLIKSYPYGLSYYNCLIGGIKGAWEKGMEVTYWAEPLSDPHLIQFLNQLPQKNLSLGVRAGPIQGLVLLQEEGKLRRDLTFLPKRVLGKDSPPREYFDYYLLNGRQGFFTEEDWRIYRERKPVFSVMFQRVPLALLYQWSEIEDLLSLP